MSKLKHAAPVAILPHGDDRLRQHHDVPTLCDYVRAAHPTSRFAKGLRNRQPALPELSDLCTKPAFLGRRDSGTFVARSTKNCLDLYFLAIRSPY